MEGQTILHQKYEGFQTRVSALPLAIRIPQYSSSGFQSAIGM